MVVARAVHDEHPDIPLGYVVKRLSQECFQLLKAKECRCERCEDLNLGREEGLESMAELEKLSREHGVCCPADVPALPVLREMFTNAVEWVKYTYAQHVVFSEGEGEQCAMHCCVHSLSNAADGNKGGTSLHAGWPQPQHELYSLQHAVSGAALR